MTGTQRAHPLCENRRARAVERRRQAAERETNRERRRRSSGRSGGGTVRDTLVMSALVGAGALLAAGFALLQVLDRRTERRRRAERARWAAERGWRLHAGGGSWATRWAGHPFGAETRPVATDVMTGRFPPHDAVVFDLAYGAHRDASRSNGRREGARRHDALASVRSSEFAVHALQLPAALPGLHLSVEGRADRAATALGARDLEVESDDFNRAYRIDAEDPRLAVDILTPRTMAMLLDCGGPDVRIDGDWIILVTPDPVDLSMIDAALTVLATVVENVPGFVWTDRGVPPPVRPRSRP